MNYFYLCVCVKTCVQCAYSLFTGDDDDRPCHLLNPYTKKHIALIPLNFLD